MLDAVYRGAAEGPAVVLCHGFGADAHDLASLADVIPLSAAVRWVFPQAPYAFRTMWGTGRAWFPRNPAEIEEFMQGPSLQHLAGADPPDLITAAEELVELLQSLAAADRMVVGGFSQGSMVGLEAALRLDSLPAGLLLMSGNLIAERRLRQAVAARSDELAGLRIAQYHGMDDPVLPFEAARQLSELLAGAGADLRFTSFRGGHGIPPQLYRSIGEELEAMLGER